MKNKMFGMRTLSLALTTILCVSLLAGCGGGSSASSTPAAPAASDSSAEASGTQPAASQPAASGDTIKVGVLAPLTGSVAQYGTAVRNGAVLYFEQLNANGGINGKLVELVEYDEEGDPAKAVTGYNYLMDQGITAMIGDVTTAPTLAVVPEAFVDNLPMITASATAAAVTVNEEDGSVYTNVFRSCFIDPFQGEKMASFAVEKLEAKTAAILFNTGSDYSVGLKDSFIAKAGEMGLEIVSTEGYADGAVDFQSQLTNIAAKAPDVLFVPDYYETVALVAQQAKSADVTAAMMGPDGWDAVMSVISDPSLLEGSYYCSGYSEEDPTPAVQQFLADYKARYNETPNMFGIQAYDAGMILAAALEKAEAAGLAAGSDEYKQAVIDAIKATDMDCVTGHVTYDEFNNPNKDAVIINITGGAAKFWGKY